MKACVLEAIGELQYRNAATPTPRDGEVLLKVRASGICSSDIDRVFKTGTYHFPTIPGHEFAGKIVDLGRGVDESLLHRRAAVFPLLPCFDCPSCSTGAYARCDNYNYFGSRCDGAFAEYIAVPVWNLVLIPDNVSFSAAALCEPAAVALHAVNAARLAPGESVAIMGNGTIGLLAAMWARIHGAGQVIIVGRSEQKIQFAKKLGFDLVYSTLKNDVEAEIRQITANRGADATLEMVGNAQSIAMAISSVKKGGTVVLTGNPEKEIALERSIYWKILRNELTLKGTWNSDYQAAQNDWMVAADFMARGLLQTESLITHRFSLDQAEQAFDILTDKSSPVVKVIFEMND